MSGITYSSSQTSASIHAQVEIGCRSAEAQSPSEPVRLDDYLGWGHKGNVLGFDIVSGRKSNMYHAKNERDAQIILVL